MSTFFDMDCGGETVTLERTDDDNFIFHGLDEETELAAIELGFEPSACWTIWTAINNNVSLDSELLYRASRGSALLVEALVFAGADVRVRGYLQWTPLHEAVMFGKTDIVKVLLEAGSIVDAKDRGGSTPLHLASRLDLIDVAKILLEAGASVSAKDHDKRTPLHEAAAEGNADIVKILLEAGASTDARTRGGKTPLSIATSDSRVEVAEILEDWIAEHGE